MKISRVIIRNLKTLVDRDDPLAVEAGSDEPAKSICFRGMNGRGKTTYLEAIASLWELFRRWTQRVPHVNASAGSLLRTADLIAVRLVDLPGPAPTLWLVYGRAPLWHSIPRSADDSNVVGLLFGGGKSMKPVDFQPGPEGLFDFWNGAATRLEHPVSQGIVEPLPNVVMVGAENRVLGELREDLFELGPEEPFRWLSRYEPSTKKHGHLENSMAVLLAVDPERFRKIAEQLRSVLPHLELLDRADPQTRRPLVRLQGGQRVTLGALSAGERAALITLFTVARWLAPGGVVLIDEPELHQHLSLMRNNLAVLEQFVTVEMKGQLMVASHAPEVWDHFRWPRRIVDLDEPSQGASSLDAAQ